MSGLATYLRNAGLNNQQGSGAYTGLEPGKGGTGGGSKKKKADTKAGRKTLYPASPNVLSQHLGGE